MITSKLLIPLSLLLSTTAGAGALAQDRSASVPDDDASSSASDAQSGSQSTGGSDAPQVPLPQAMSLGWPHDFSASEIGDREIGVVALQALLDRSAHSPGVIDGYMGGNTRRAIRAFRQANGLGSGGEADEELWQALRQEFGSAPVFTRYTLTQDDVNGPFHDVPSGFAAQAKLDRLGYEDVVEMLGERFHMDQGFLRFLNPDTSWSAGDEIVVIQQPDTSIAAGVQRIEVDKAAGTVRAYDGSDNLLVTYPATIGSTSFPSPSGTMTVKAVAPDPKYYFDPEGRSWGPQRELTIAPGPNNPVGGTWIDLSKEGYGIHGSPDPQLIGKTSSHGCVRLTNWDAAELAKATVQGATVTFV